MPVFPVIEFRQYRLHPGTRETLVDLFDTEFVESQEACGMTVIGQFRDLDDPDRFTWLRGFSSWDERPAALGKFYDGPVWVAHRNAANATMIDSDDVHLLRPAETDSQLPFDASRRSPHAGMEAMSGVYLAILCQTKAGLEVSFHKAAGPLIASAIVKAGGELTNTLATLGKENNWPRLPVHADRNVALWFARLDSLDSANAAIAMLLADPFWNQAVANFCSAPPELRRLSPTARSAMQ